MSGVLAARTISTCPSWCEEPAGHRDMDEDDILEDPMVRTHVGRFGMLKVGITEGQSDLFIARMRRQYGAEKVAEMMAPTVDLVPKPLGRDFDGPEELRQLAADALKAAEWLESRE